MTRKRGGLSFESFLEKVSIAANVTSCGSGRQFETRVSAIGNARSPTVKSRERRITNCEYDDDRRRRRFESATSDSIPWRQTVQISLDKHGRLEVDALMRLQPMKASKYQCDLLVYKENRCNNDYYIDL